MGNKGRDTRGKARATPSPPSHAVVKTAAGANKSTTTRTASKRVAIDSLVAVATDKAWTITRTVTPDTSPRSSARYGPTIALHLLRLV
jgi:hypothetical protein